MLLKLKLIRFVLPVRAWRVKMQQSLWSLIVRNIYQIYRVVVRIQLALTNWKIEIKWTSLKYASEFFDARSILFIFISSTLFFQSFLKLRCVERFTHAFTACGCVFKKNYVGWLKPR